MTDPPQIRTRLWHSTDSHLSSAYKSAHRVNPWRTGQLCPAEIEPSYRKETLVTDDSYYLMKIPHFVINNKDVAYRHQLVERVQ